jgi:shikimate kinase
LVQLVGPGGAGKTTIGARLAERLAIRFIDLDAEFVGRHGDISAYLDSHGYHAYAARNVALYSDLVAGVTQPTVVALSSGFMTYPDVHPAYLARREQIASSPSTFVLLPSVDVETCVAETVRRQLGRPFARPAKREEKVIRERFPLYMRLPCCRIETMRSIETVVTELATMLGLRTNRCTTDALGVCAMMSTGRSIHLPRFAVTNDHANSRLARGDQGLDRNSGVRRRHGLLRL